MQTILERRAQELPAYSKAETPKQDRILSLDVLRGFDMFWIVGGEGIIHSLAIATGWQFFKVLSVQLEHVRWEGFHFYDNIFPLFLFIVGAVIPFALVSRPERGEPRPEIYRKVITRFMLLIILGLIYNQGWHQNWAKPFIGSVLGEIAFAYLFASFIVLHTRKIRYIIMWTAGIMVAVALIHFLLPVPGYGRGVFTLRGSANAYIDRTLNPGEIYFYMTPAGDVYNLAHCPMPPDAVPVADAEGILNWFSVTSITLMGVIAGLILRNQSIKPHRKVAIYVVSGAGLLLGAFALKPWYPIIKMIHTGTFYMLAGGCSFLLLALFYLVIDIWKMQRWAFFFKVVGMNAIVLYMGCQLVNVNYTSGVLVGGLAMYLGAFGPVLISLVTAALVWTSGYLLYRKKIFLRV